MKERTRFSEIEVDCTHAFDPSHYDSHAKTDLSKIARYVDMWEAMCSAKPEKFDS